MKIDIGGQVQRIVVVEVGVFISFEPHLESEKTPIRVDEALHGQRNFHWIDPCHTQFDVPAGPNAIIGVWDFQHL